MTLLPYTTAAHQQTLQLSPAVCSGSSSQLCVHGLVTVFVPPQKCSCTLTINVAMSHLSTTKSSGLEAGC